ncbi:MAG: 4Fe-4S dicluster domain-containing protein [Deltaproteobacteria bacterium]|nr:4Fe-4S dicluster domain-containing protein [Deltaproteobacteria bacterium]
MSDNTSDNTSRSLLLHPERCTGCLRCELACSFERTGQYQPSRSVIRVLPLEGHTSQAPFVCWQCREGWCMTACPVDAISIAPTGARVVSAGSCVGCRLCVIACPYGTMFMDPAGHRADKCDLCGGRPACVRACPTGAIEYAGGAPDGEALTRFAASRCVFDLKGRAG